MPIDVTSFSVTSLCFLCWQSLRERMVAHFQRNIQLEIGLQSATLPAGNAAEKRLCFKEE